MPIHGIVNGLMVTTWTWTAVLSALLMFGSGRSLLRDGYDGFRLFEFCLFASCLVVSCIIIEEFLFGE